VKKKIFCEKKKTIGELFPATPEIFPKMDLGIYSVLTDFSSNVHTAFFFCLFCFLTFKLLML